ncbi:uncharacterized protein MELLADRAFT_87538 [Melampsora larici-populina 98AG31]|uniref:Uncharacterized protein n=1 Tax=Melampsora larici-populina (strain 98AG31 / pathotype 3-4-7) TaxID=747676 RepID=F4RNQ0_MELLP|nr:uncharacterized protein MELLADRAFT_87538 [Melampsora larici-populina 98AG31]EGG06025.1 hypothetical protein MELLADRAFT_87538 [Melampsora larici-populina 98AG31]
MSSCPAGWVHEVYSHPGWLPLLTDRVGNYIGVDLSPPMVLDPDHDLNPSLNSKRIIGGGQGNSQASVGQVIAFGREIDEKVVLWNGDGQEGWGKWLSSFADDLEQGNFAILGGTHHHHHHSLKNSKRSSSNEINQDDESGWKVESDEDEEDGIGELGYFHDGNLQSDWKDSSESKLWKLSNQFRGMNVIEALCERSKQRWSEIGLYSSSATRPNPTHRQKPSLQAHSRPGPSNPNPTQSPHQHPPPGFASGSHASLPSQPDTPIAFVTPPSPRPSTDQLRPDHSTSTNLNVMNPSNKLVRKRTIPPAPASLSLPTMDDMIKDEIEEDEEGIGLSSSTTSSIGNGNHQVHSQENSLGRLSALGLRNELEFGSELESIGMRMIKLDEMKIQNEV